MRKQDKCLKAAAHLAVHLKLFLSIKEQIDDSKDCRESRQAFERMLDLIAQISDYIVEYAFEISSGTTHLFSEWQLILNDV